MDLFPESYHASYLRQFYMKVVHECIHEGYHAGGLRWVINEGCSRIIFTKVAGCLQRLYMCVSMYGLLKGYHFGCLKNVTCRYMTQFHI